MTSHRYSRCERVINSNFLAKRADACLQQSKRYKFAINMLRRRGGSPTPQSKAEEPDKAEKDDAVEPMDEDDQEKLVKKFSDEAARLTKRFQQFFTVVVVFAMVLSLALPVLCETECTIEWESCWLHAFYSALNHGLVIYKSRGDLDKQATTDLGLNSLITVIPVVMWILGIFQEDIEHFHIGLIIGNVVTFFASLLVQWDAQSTRHTLEGLKAAQYRHKKL